MTNNKFALLNFRGAGINRRVVRIYDSAIGWVAQLCTGSKAGSEADVVASAEADVVASAEADLLVMLAKG